MKRVSETLSLILLGLSLIAFAFFTIFSTGPFIFVTVLPGFFTLWAGLHRGIGPPWAFIISFATVAAGFVAPSFV
jgi:hypothetical protein